MTLRECVKQIVVSSDFLSTIRRKCRYCKYCVRYKKRTKSFSTTRYPQELLALKDMHKGERCFIIGNGPSLTPEDLNAIKGEISFAANRVYLIFERTEWRPSFFLCQDENIVRQITDFLESYEGEIFLDYMALFDFGIDIPKARYYLNNGKEATLDKKELSFSDDFHRYAINGGSVTYASIQLAVYMGFKEIYLLGVDHNFSHTLNRNRKIIEHEGVSKDYFDDRYKDIFKKQEVKGRVFSAPDKEMITRAYEASKRYCDKNGIKIVNCTRGGKLEVFFRMNLEDVISNNDLDE